MSQNVSNMCTCSYYFELSAALYMWLLYDNLGPGCLFDIIILPKHPLASHSMTPFLLVSSTVHSLCAALLSQTVVALTADVSRMYRAIHLWSRNVHILPSYDADDLWHVHIMPHVCQAECLGPHSTLPLHSQSHRWLLLQYTYVRMSMTGSLEEI